MKYLSLIILILIAGCSKDLPKSKAQKQSQIFSLNSELNSLKSKGKLTPQEQEKVKELQEKMQEEIKIYNKKYSKIKAN